MAESVAKEVLRAGASITLPGGFEFFINISTDNVDVASQLVKKAWKSVTTLGALYLGYKSARFLIETAVKKGLGGERADQEVGDIKPGSLHVRLHCLTDERFLQVFADYESGRMKERLQEEFLQVGIQVEGLKVVIQNMVEVNKAKEAINKRILHKSMEKTDEEQHKKEHLSMVIMKRMPQNVGSLFEEATSLGLLGSNPNLMKPRAKLLECIHSSMNIKRSFNHVSILLVGTSGVGKSATVNHLLGVELAETSETESKTRSTKEFTIYGDDPRYEVKELPLGLIDTPGSCDTDGSKQDACNLLSVQKFFNSHPKLSKCFPNLVLLVVKATDNRIKGENSELGKSLRCIKQLGLVDSKNPNVVVILSHACSIRKKNDEEWTKALDKIKSNVTKIVFADLKVFAPVVLIENMYDDCDLEHLGDYTVLPNKELQAKNLYEACANVLKNNKDSLGLITLNSIFVQSEKNKNRRIEPGYKVEAKKAKQCKLDGEETTMVEFFQRAAEGGFEDPLYTAILQYISDQKLEGKEKQEVMKIAGILKHLGEGDPPDFASHSIYSIEYFLGEEISPIGRQMLHEKFKVAENPPNKHLESARLVGQGYNILTDKSVAAQVMHFDTVTIKYGATIPACAKFERVQQSRSFMEEFKDEVSYTQSRLKSLNVNLNVKPDIFRMSNRAGYNKKVATSSSSTSEYSFLFEHRLFELKLGNYKDYLNHGMTFTDDFKSDVAKLPNKYDKSDDGCVSKFERFFNRFGHFVVSSAYGGGSVEIKCSSGAVRSTETSLADAKACLTAALEGLDLTEGAFDKKKTLLKKTLLKQSGSSWSGGDAAFQTNETIRDKQKLQKWKDSLLKNPMMLTSELTLEPISILVGLVDDGEKDEATYNALKDLLESEIKIRDKKEKKKTLWKKVKAAITRFDSLIEPDLDDEDGCFPSRSMVKVQNKEGEVQRKKVANLNVGDKVMGWDEKRNRAVFSKVIMFAHLAPDAGDVEYLKITLEDGNEITLSGNHLVMVGKQTKAILARKVKPGDILFNVNENQEISPKKVFAVEKVIEQGIFCPITLSGNVIVDNVLASCYASVEDHVLVKGLVKISAQNMAHLGLMPMRALHKLRSKWLRKIPNGQTIHPYVKWLCKLNHPCMAHEHA